jgi:hypothetical protein
MQHHPSSPCTLALEAVDHFLRALADSDHSAERIAACFHEHISTLPQADLPPSAQDAWNHVTHLLRTPADKPIPDKAVLAIRSWPQSRVNELMTHIRHLRAALEKVENDRLEDEIRDTIRRHYL